MKPFVAVAAAALLFAAPSAFAQTSDTTTTQAAQAVGAEEFVRTAGSSNRLEIESSQLAVDRGVTGEVLSFAQQMVADHTKAGEEMKAALEETDMTAATGEPELLDKHAQMLEELQGLEGEEFEQKYVEMQVQAHDEAVALFSGYAENGEQQALKDFAAKTLPTLEQHQEHIKQIAEGEEG